MKGLARAIRLVIRLAVPYFKSRERWSALVLLVAVVVIELCAVYLTVRLNVWNRLFFNALQQRQFDVFMYQLGVFFILACSLVLTTLLTMAASQSLLIRWRRWMTEGYVTRWLKGSNHYRIMVGGYPVDNPDQRISMDIKTFLTQSMTLGVGLLRSVATLGSFIVILWGLSARTPLPIGGHNYAFPGYLVVAAIASAIIGTVLTHLVGRRLIRLNFMQEHYEADFRFDLVGVRENSEQIALLKGESVEEHRLMDRYRWVFRNSFALLWRTVKMTSFTSGWGQLTAVLPSLLIAPAYFANVIQIGLLFQISSAFVSVDLSLSYFITAYAQLAEWKATVDRLTGFQDIMDEATAAAEKPPRVEVQHEAGCEGVEVGDLDVRLPDGRSIVQSCGFTVEEGDRVLVSGASGIGKSTLFRALAGIWPFASGTVSFAQGAKVMVVPQRPYVPTGTLAQAIAFPETPDRWSAAEMAEAVKAAGLGGFVERLQHEDQWRQRLSTGEQQRVAIARALLHQPDVLFLDESTASLDEPSEKHLYGLIRSRLPRTTVISIGHRSSLKAFHRRHFQLVADGATGRLVEGETALSASQQAGAAMAVPEPARGP